MARRSQAKKTTTTRKRYSTEFRDEALALAERLGVPAAAKALGLHASQLYGWRVKARAERDQLLVGTSQDTTFSIMQKRRPEGRRHSRSYD